MLRFFKNRPIWSHCFHIFNVCLMFTSVTSDILKQSKMFYILLNSPNLVTLTTFKMIVFYISSNHYVKCFGISFKSLSFVISLLSLFLSQLKYISPVQALSRRLAVAGRQAGWLGAKFLSKVL